jgi:hypothetical protein
LTSTKTEYGSPVSGGLGPLPSSRTKSITWFLTIGSGGFPPQQTLGSWTWKVIHLKKRSKFAGNIPPIVLVIPPQILETSSVWKYITSPKAPKIIRIPRYFTNGDFFL